MAQYTHTNRLEFRTALKKALSSDPSVGNYWPDAELNLLINQALLTFGAFSGFWKDDILIETKEAQTIYDIFSADVVSATKVAPTITFGDMVAWLNIDLIEAISETEQTSDLFSLTELFDLVKAKYNGYQLKTNSVLSQLSLNVPAQNNSIELPDNLVDIVDARFVYVDEDGNTITILLQRVDEEELSYFDGSLLTEQALPQYFSTVYGRNKTIKLYGIPNITGTLQLLSILGQDDDAQITVDTIINLPNNLVPYLKYEILSDIFNKDGLLKDAARAAYCEARIEEGITIGKNYAVILLAKANGLMIDTDSINKLNEFVELESSDDPPTILGLAGLNIFSLDVIPTTTVNSIQITANLDAPLPIRDTDYIDTEVGYIDPLTNYCIHLAQFKNGIFYIESTKAYLMEFQKVSLGYNTRLQKRGITFENIARITQKEQQEKPRLAELVTA